MPRVIGKEVFKNIVTMAYEMEVADRLMTKVKQDLIEFYYRLNHTTRFREEEDLLEDFTKVWKVAHTNKKYYKLDEYHNDGETVTQWYSNKKIALTTSGRYSAFVRVVKYISDSIGEGTFLDIWREWDEDGDCDEDNNRIMLWNNAPTIDIIANIKQNLKVREEDMLKEQLSNICSIRHTFKKNAQVWAERFAEIEKHHLLVLKLSS